MTRLTAGALTDPQLPATASHVCTTDARLGGVGRVPPQTKTLAMPVVSAGEFGIMVRIMVLGLGLCVVRVNTTQNLNSNP